MSANDTATPVAVSLTFVVFRIGLLPFVARSVIIADEDRWTGD